MRPLSLLSVICSIAIITQASTYYEDRFPTETGARRLSSISSSFTNSDGYNTWDHAQIPLGIFEYQKAMTTLNLGYRRLKWKDVANFDSTRVFNGIIMPAIRVGAPGKVFLDLHYSINPISITDYKETPSMLLNRFALTVIGQVEDGRFQIGMTGQGYIGKEEWDANSNERILMGGDNVGLFLGFKLHEVVLLNVFGHTAGYIDTLYMGKVDGVEYNYPQERFSWFQMPEINVAMDIGKEDMPYMSNMSITYSHNNFVYTGKKDENTPMFEDYYDTLNNQNALSEYNEGGDIDPIVSDSIAWHMQHLWNIEVNDILCFDPAVQLGYWHSRYKHMEPNGDNYPVNYDGERPGWEWDTKSFRFGLGGTWWMREITKIWVEYSYNSLKLEVTGDKLDRFKDEVPRNNGYSRLGLGFTTNFDEIPRLGMPESVGLFFTFGFLFMQDNLLTGPYGSKPFHRMYPIYDNTVEGLVTDLAVELNRYQPWEVIKHQLNTMHIGFGIGATFLDNAFETSFHFGILNQRFTTDPKDEYKGFEFGIDLIYNRLGTSGNSPDQAVDKAKTPATSSVPENSEVPYNPGEQPNQQY